MKNFLKDNWFIFVTAICLIGALGTWPYAYYQLLRWVVCGVSAYTAYKAYETERTGWTWIFGITAVLFNPIAPFYAQRQVWQIFDAVTAVLFILYPFLKNISMRRGRILKILRLLGIVVAVILAPIIIAILVSTLEKPF